jgi:hypothetical protein
MRPTSSWAGAGRTKSGSGTERPRLNRPVLLHRDKKLPEKKQHFTAKQCRDEPGIKCVQVYFSNLCLNAYAVEDALQNRLQCYPLGVRLWREVAKGQKEKDKKPNTGRRGVQGVHHLQLRRAGRHQERPRATFEPLGT